MPAAAAVNEDAVGTGTVEDSPVSCIVEDVVLAAEGEDDVEDVIADVRTAASVALNRDEAVETQLALALPLHVLLLLLSPS